MALSNCQEATDVSRIKIEEVGRYAVFVNLGRAAYVKTKIDGCVIKNSIACDWVLTHDGADLFIELKGTDVGHGLTQIGATAHYWVRNGYNCGKLAALIICSQYPRIVTGIQRAKLHFARNYNGPLHVVSRNREFAFRDLFDFI